MFQSNLVSQLPQRLNNVNLHPREDGFFYAECRTPEGRYFISRDEAISTDLFSFRREIHEALQQEVDLIFLLGIGLGYRLKAAWETIHCCNQGYLVVLEETPEIFSAACEASDLRSVFQSPRCEFLILPSLQDQIVDIVQKRSWFGAKRSRFYWGYQASEKAYQPRYDQFADHITLLMAEMQKKLVYQWKEWVKTKTEETIGSMRTAIIYEIDSHKPCPLPQKIIDRIHTSYPEYVAIEIPRDRYVSPTFLMQRLLETNPDRLLWIDLPQDKWLPPEAATSLPIPSEKIEL